MTSRHSDFTSLRPQVPRLAWAVSVALAVLQPVSAGAFTFVGDRRIEDPGLPGSFLPEPVHWAVPTVPAPVPGAPPIRRLTATFNTAPGFAVPAADQPAVQRAIDTWGNRRPIANADNFTTFPMGFPAGTPVKVAGANTFDLESIVLHEVGHALGLGHPNFADRNVGPGRPGPVGRFTASTLGANGRMEAAGLDGTPGNFDDRRGDDRSLHLVDRDNNPFNAFNGSVDKATFSLDGPFGTGGYAQAPTREVAAAGRAKTGFAAISNLEAVMVQGARPLEAQRELTRDDVHGIDYLQSGPDQIRGGRFAQDDYILDLVYNAAGVAGAEGAPPAGVHILVNNVALAPALGRTVFTRPLASARILYDIDEATGHALSQTDLWFDGPLDSPGTSLVFADISWYEGLGPLVVEVPEPASTALLALGIGTLWAVRQRRARLPVRR